MAGAPEHRSRFDQDFTPRSAGRHGSTGSRPDVSGAQHSPFQESATSVNCKSDNTSTDWLINDPDDHQMNFLCGFLDFNEDGCEIETSVNANEEKPEDNDQKPQRGMIFSSVIEAEEFYKNYAKKTGFTVRKGKIHKQPDGTLKWRRFLCSCEGFRAKKQSNQGTKYQRLDTRTGCEAQMQVTLENEQWVITNLQLAHNHSLKNSNGSSDKSIQDTQTGPSEKLEGASEADTACPEHQLKQLKPQAVDSRRAKGEVRYSQPLMTCTTRFSFLGQLYFRS
ncbi:hypothetical protein PVL29_024672 [Vitis rotundifolia]|uniref:FAR1 domain-containing protein n=1 Tax=Vitis rotundifolia TaxID=103349 RepID=A0AA38YSP5_VITRO|nr:hypothetical protein PVL29_024672 [Vitis rotundifolia]